MLNIKAAKIAVRVACALFCLSMLWTSPARADISKTHAAIQPIHQKAVQVINYRIQTDRISLLLDKQRVARKVLAETVLAKAQGLEQEALEELINQSIGVLTTSAGEIGESMEAYGKGITTGLDAYEKYGLATDLYNDGVAETLKGQLLSKIPYYDLLASVAKITKMFVKYKDIEYQMKVLEQYDEDLEKNQIIFGKTKESLGKKLSDALGDSASVDRQAEKAMQTWSEELVRIVNSGDQESLDTMAKYLTALASAYKVVAGKSTGRYSEFETAGKSALSATRNYLQSKSKLQSIIAKAQGFLEQAQVNKSSRYIGKCMTTGMTSQDHALIRKRQSTLENIEKTHRSLNLTATENGVKMAQEIKKQLDERSTESQIDLVETISVQYREINTRLAAEARACELKPSSYELAALCFSLLDASGAPVFSTEGVPLAADALTAAALGYDRYRTYRVKGRYVRLAKRKCCFSKKVDGITVQDCDSTLYDAEWDVTPSGRVADFSLPNAEPNVSGGRLDTGQQKIYPDNGSDSIRASLSMPGVKVVNGGYYQGFHAASRLDCEKASDKLESADIKAKVVLNSNANAFTRNPPEANYEIDVARAISFAVIGEAGEPMEAVDLLPRSASQNTLYHHRLKLVLKYSLGGKAFTETVSPQSIRFDIQGDGLRLETENGSVTVLGSASTKGILRILVKNTETDALDLLKEIPVRSARIQTEVVLPETANSQFASDQVLLPVGEMAEVRVFASGTAGYGDYRVLWQDGVTTAIGEVRKIGFDSYSTDADGNFQSQRIDLSAKIIGINSEAEGNTLSFSPSSFRSTWPIVTSMRLEPAGADIFLPINKNEQGTLVPSLNMKLVFRDGSKQRYKTFPFSIPGTNVSINGMNYIDSANLGTHLITKQVETTVDARGRKGIFVENDIAVDRAVFTINRMEVNRLGEEADAAYRLRIDGPASLSGYTVHWTDETGKTLTTGFNGRESVADTGKTFQKVALKAQGGRIAGVLDLTQWTPLPPPTIGAISVSEVPMKPGATVDLTARVQNLRVWSAKKETGYYGHWEAVPAGAGRFLENDTWLSGYGHTDSQQINTQFELFDSETSPASVNFTLKLMRRDADYGGSTDE